MSRRTLRAGLALSALVALCTPTLALAAQPDWFTSVYTPGGVEVRADERLFTLFALLNALGYDEGPVVRKDPLVKHAFSPVRVQVRQAMSTLDPKLRDEASAFFDAHPLPLADYVAFTAQLGAAPAFTATSGIHPAGLAGFEKVLAKVYVGAKVHALFAQVQAEYRTDTKGYLAEVDAPLAKARKLLRDPAAKAVIAVNDLDGRGAASGVPVGDEALLVIGPDPKPDVQGVIRAYARVILDPVMAKRSKSLKGAEDQAAVVRGNGGPALASGADYASALLARAIAIKVASANPAADEDAALKLGFAGIKEAVKSVDDLPRGAGPLEASVAELLSRIDLKKGR